MGALLDAVPAGGADHTEHHRDLATAVEAIQGAYQPLDSDLTAIAALTTTAYGRSLLTLANQAALQAEAGGGGGALTPGVDYPTSATVTLSSADILDLHNTPVTLVAAPGAGKYLSIHKVDVHLTGSTIAYTVADAVQLRFTGWASFLSLAGLLAGDTGDRTYQYSTVESSGDTAGYVNNSVELYAVDANPADGDGGLVLTVHYTEHSVPA